jgi:hypothetical protein
MDDLVSLYESEVNNVIKRGSVYEVLHDWQIIFLGWLLEQIRDQILRIGPHGIYVWLRGNYGASSVEREVTQDATFRCIEDAIVWMSVNWSKWKITTEYDDDFRSFEDFWNFYWEGAQKRFGVLPKNPHSSLTDLNMLHPELFPSEHLFFVKDAFVREFMYWVPAELFAGPGSRGNKRLLSKE